MSQFEFSEFLEKFRQALAKVDFVSFDIFDTVLVRDVLFPIDIFTAVAEQNGDETFSERRVKAEVNARVAKKETNEVSLSEIYKLLPSFDPQVEIDLERDSLTANHEFIQILKMVRDSGKKLVFASDTYFSTDQLQTFLAGAGIYEGERIFASSELGLSKAKGDLFPHILRELGIYGSKLLHVGDNRTSDNVHPAKNSIETIPYSSPRDRLLGKAAYRSFAELTSTGNLQASRALAAAVGNFGSTKPDWFGMGFQILGPASLGFASWIKAQSDLLGIEKLAFLARDGFLPFEAFTSLFGNFPATYAYVSRQPLILLQALSDFDQFSRDLTNTDSQTVEVLLASMGLAEVPGLKAAVAAELGKNAMVGVNFDNRTFIEVLKSKQSEIVTFVQNRYGEYAAYLRTEFDSPGRIGLVDLGWNGTQQRLLSQFTGHEFVGFYVGTTKAAKAIANSKSFIFDSERNKRDRGIVFSSIPIIEFLFSSPEERFTNRVAGKNQFAIEQSGSEGSAKAELAEGVSAYLKAVQATSFDASKLVNPELLFQPLLTMLVIPDKETATLFGILHHQQNAGSAKKLPVLLLDGGAESMSASAWPAGQSAVSGLNVSRGGARIVQRVGSLVRKVRNYGLVNSVRIILRRLIK